MRGVEELAARTRLSDKGTLCQSSLSKAEPRWLQDSRPDEARYWNLLTDLVPEHLDYGD
jgi:hypothetical protein